MRKLTSGFVVVVLVIVWFAGVGNSQPTGITRTELGRGTVSRPYTVSGSDKSDVVVQSVQIEPGGTSGWHTHPGPELAIIKAGTLTFFDGKDDKCAPKTETAGQAIVRPGHVHMARNDTKETVEIVTTYFDVPPGGAAAAPAARPKQCPEG
jgi:quercetin dioxygenase-like cupin family protein